MCDIVSCLFNFDYILLISLLLQLTFHSNVVIQFFFFAGSYMDIGENDFPYYNDVPDVILPYIIGWNNVVGDGHCGFRVVADAFQDGGEEDWPHVRNFMRLEIMANPDIYDVVYGGRQFREEALERISYNRRFADRGHWMEVSQDLYAIANLFDCAVFLYHLMPGNVIYGCCTVLPWNSSTPTQEGPKKELAIALIESDKHYIRLHLADDHPVPPIAEYWNTVRRNTVVGWENLYARRIEQWRNLVLN